LTLAWNKAGVNTVIHGEEKVMTNQKKLMILATMLAFLIMLPAARASQEDQATKLIFTKDVQIPGRVLPAGTYWFIAVETNTAPKIIEVFNSDRSMLYATILTRDTERSNPTDDTTWVDLFMEEAHQLRGPLRFGVFELDLRAGELRKNGLRASASGTTLQSAGDAA
jgi:hypothetical protein